MADAQARIFLSDGSAEVAPGETAVNPARRQALVADDSTRANAGGHFGRVLHVPGLDKAAEKDETADDPAKARSLDDKPAPGSANPKQGPAPTVPGSEPSAEAKHAPEVTPSPE